ncbi:hypothetical protein J2X31_000797 [Flavobacterium arsenatis]|uniref:Uncharacterized protein n=1 Tax=Flavobacterium arsenatis TaxID=1484332 RepID=A0ABU1TLF7_9FLAO|nr:hypothetical protein [Flavobacterium arsenatis]MDR6966799.1 hypothetical protein [Flavobacterium arsenatis]
MAPSGLGWKLFELLETLLAQITVESPEIKKPVFFAPKKRPAEALFGA